MSNLIERKDYPGQVLHCRRFGPFSGGESQIDVADSGSVLIVSNDVETDLTIDPALNLYAHLSKPDSNISLQVLRRDEKSAARLNSFLQTRKLKPVLDYEQEPGGEILGGPVAEQLADSYHFYHWLRSLEKGYSLVVFVDALAEAYYSLVAREMGLLPEDTRFILYASKSSYFDMVRSTKPLIEPGLLNLLYAERMAMNMADAFVSNSQVFLNWVLENEMKEMTTPLYCMNLPVCLVEDSERSASAAEPSTAWRFIFGNNCITEMLFAAEALKRLGENAADFVFYVPSRSKSRAARELSSYTRSLPVTVKSYSGGSLLRELSNQPHGMVVVPAMENINGVIYTQLAETAGDFRSNGLRYDDESDKYCQASYNRDPETTKSHIAAQHDKVSDAVHAGEKSSEDHWRALVEFLLREKGQPRNEHPSETPEIRVSVCISHHNRSVLLNQALESIYRQSQPAAEIIVVDDGSSDRASIESVNQLESTDTPVPVKVIRQPNSYIGASRNAGLAAATGNYILFMDDDNEAMPHELEFFVKSVQITGADITTCLSKVFAGENPSESEIPLQTALFVGPNVAAGLISNPLGDSNMFASVKALKSIGGFSEHYRIGKDDQELLTRACLNGLDVRLLPLPLYYYRLSKTRIRSRHLNPYSGFDRVMQTYGASVPVELAQQLRFLQGLAYATGPWGANLRVSEFKLAMIEYLRIYVAKFPVLYRIFAKLKSLIN